MDITYDPTKDETNKAKHGLSLADAVHLDWDELLVKPDTRKDYGERREIGYGLIDERLYCVVFVQRGQSCHVISLRKANSREVKAYESQT
ncbi:BrnT family toxin [Oxalobacter sp. OttesenSCG-928-P03]|nr:BrnT family toxin [Oxalobacter sp. OttesenSCG-928-P03]